MRVLLIEDDELLGEGIRGGLSVKGCTVEWAQDGRAGEHLLAQGGFDAVLLDLQLPHKSGMTLLRELRARDAELPVLILTARDAVSDRVAGLEAGADDYILKPFDLHELVARIRAVRRRSTAPDRIEHGDVVFDRAARTLTSGGMPVDLPRRELLLIEALLENRGRVLTSDRLHQKIYGWDDAVESNAIAVHVHNLRRKLGRDLIRTVRGLGYTIPKDLP